MLILIFITMHHFNCYLQLLITFCSFACLSSRNCEITPGVQAFATFCLVLQTTFSYILYLNLSFVFVVLTNIPLSLINQIYLRYYILY